jgi:hypothetical protein
MIYCFGDSWAAGAELKFGQKPFVHWLARELDAEYANLGKSGSSLGIILHTLISNIEKLTSDDLVLIIVPPDTRWYDENKQNGFYSVMSHQRDDYLKFLNSKTTEWFKYHHALFVYSIQKILNDVGCQYIMAHNYGQIDEIKKYGLSIDFDRFLCNNDLTTILSDSLSTWKNYADHLPPEHRFDTTGPPVELFSGRYFEGCRQHPNELGHKHIAELLLEKYNRDKK